MRSTFWRRCGERKLLLSSNKVDYGSSYDLIDIYGYNCTRIIFLINIIRMHREIMITRHLILTNYPADIPPFSIKSSLH